VTCLLSTDTLDLGGAAERSAGEMGSLISIVTINSINLCAVDLVTASGNYKLHANPRITGYVVRRGVGTGIKS
jgi:hypothetical protein